MITLTNNTLLVKGEMTDVFTVKNLKVRKDMIIDFDLVPNEYTAENGIEIESLSFDPLNETLVQVLKEEGYHIITPEQVKNIQNQGSY